MSSETPSFDLDLLNDFLIGQGGDPALVPVEEDPGPNAIVVEETVHDKLIVLEDFKVKLKWTALGYGQMTEKVIVPELAKHTVFNHRNPGEEGPCLRSFRTFGQTELEHEGALEISIKILNRYEMNVDKKICRVTIVEDVMTLIDGVEFSHVYTKPMGFRYIDDCPMP